tara:strand:- start:268 stop:402 length:135 start_codon:yes stop_codon:yes gene_type:complete
LVKQCFKKKWAKRRRLGVIGYNNDSKSEEKKEGKESLVLKEGIN